MEPQILNKRASFFPNGIISYDAITVSMLSNLLSEFNLLPSFNNSISFQIGPNGAAESKKVKTLALNSQDGSVRANLMPDRIDIFSLRNDSFSDFSSLATRLADSIIALWKMEFNRMALCAAVFYEVPDENLRSVYSKVFNNTHEEDPIEWSSRKVTRDIITQDAHQIEINNVIIVSKNAVQINNAPLKKGIVLELDINTVVGTSVGDIMSTKEPFFSNASSLIDSAINEYLSIVSE